MADDQKTWTSSSAGGLAGSSVAGGADYADRTSAQGATPPPASSGAGQATGQAASAVSQTAQSAQQTAGQVAQKAQQAAAPITEQVQQTAGQVADQAKQQAISQVSTQKEHAAGSLDAVATALRQSGDQLRGNQQEPLANLANTAAQHVEQFSGYLRNTDVQEMIRDVEQFARRQPAAFLGGAFTLGVLAARFLKSSARPDTNQQGANAPGRRPSYRGYSGYQYSTPGMGRYPAPGNYAGSGATSSWLAPDSPTGGDPGSVDSAMPDPALRTTRAGDRVSAPGGGATASGWGYTPRSGARTEKEAQ